MFQNDQLHGFKMFLFFNFYKNKNLVLLLLLFPLSANSCSTPVQIPFPFYFITQTQPNSNSLISPLPPFISFTSLDTDTPSARAHRSLSPEQLNSRDVSQPESTHCLAHSPAYMPHQPYPIANEDAQLWGGHYSTAFHFIEFLFSDLDALFQLVKLILNYFPHFTSI